MKTIAKFFAFVILGFFVLTTASCENGPRSSEHYDTANDTSAYSPPIIIGKIDSREITESSGLAASKCRDGVLWTHNDSGDGPYIYAIDTTGKRLETWKITGAKNIDWEDMGVVKEPGGNCYLYIGDIGNNTRRRDELNIYRIREPGSMSKKSDRIDPGISEASERLRFSYPDSHHDAETLMIEPISGSIYILTKRISGAAGVYKIKAEFDPYKTQTAEKVADLSVPAIPNGLLTGGDISPDGRSVILCDYFAGYELTLMEGESFDNIWKAAPMKFSLGKRDQGEAIAFSPDGRSIYATSELKNSPLIQVTKVGQ